MSLSEEDIKAVVFYRKEKAHATLREAEIRQGASTRSGR